MAIDVAATYVLGFRTTQSTTPIDVRWVPDRPARDQLDGVIEIDPAATAATTLHADADAAHLYLAAAALLAAW